MRKKLGTRFPASRIKKIMQADEDVGKIALAVPVLVSKALELFLQDLCNRTYEVTLQSGAKTLNSLHLKQCVKMYSAFDFLTAVVNKVPTLGGTESFGDEKGISRRRKTIEHDGDTAADNSRLAKVAMTSTNITPRGRGRGGGRGRGRPPLNRNRERESSFTKYEEEVDLSPEHEDHITESDTAEKALENVNDSTNPSLPPKSDMILSSEARQGEYSTWPSNLVNVNMHIDEDEDYDNED